MIQIKHIQENKKRFLPLLLLADEQEDMIDSYLDRGDLFVLFDDDDPKGLCVITREADDLFEIKNLAVYPHDQRKGFGRCLVDYVSERYTGKATTIQAGTGEVPSVLLFYQRCGFTMSHRIPNFFIDHYDHPMIEEGVPLIDMVYLKKSL